MREAFGSSVVLRQLFSIYFYSHWPVRRYLVLVKLPHLGVQFSSHGRSVVKRTKTLFTWRSALLSLDQRSVRNR